MSRHGRSVLAEHETLGGPVTNTDHLAPFRDRLPPVSFRSVVGSRFYVVSEKDNIYDGEINGSIFINWPRCERMVDAGVERNRDGDVSPGPVHRSHARELGAALGVSQSSQSLLSADTRRSDASKRRYRSLGSR
jgi:hypothetical protein